MLDISLFFIHCFHYVKKHREGNNNIVADAFSRKANLLTILKTHVIAFASLSILYPANLDFGNLLIMLTIIISIQLTIFFSRTIYFASQKHHFVKPWSKSFMWDILGLTKPIYQLLCERYYRPQLRKDVTKFIKHCFTCQTAKVWFRTCCSWQS